MGAAPAHALYIDNPVGTGFSYTDDAAAPGAFPADVRQCADDLLPALRVFFDVFRPVARSDFFLVGESYAGKYIPALATAIVADDDEADTQTLQQPPIKINLRGIALGNALTDPLHQVPAYADYAQQRGLANLTAAMASRIGAGDFGGASDAYDALIGIYGNPAQHGLLPRLMGSWNVWDVTKSDTPDYGCGPYEDYLNRSDVRAARHFYDAMADASYYAALNANFCRSVAPLMAPLFNGNVQRVLVYSGMDDLICAPPLTERYLAALDGWAARAAWEAAERTIWRVLPTDQEVAGYVRQVPNGGGNNGTFTHALIRNSGHILPFDQPRVAEELIHRFVNGLPFGA